MILHFSGLGWFLHDLRDCVFSQGHVWCCFRCVCVCMWRHLRVCGEQRRARHIRHFLIMRLNDPVWAAQRISWTQRRDLHRSEQLLTDRDTDSAERRIHAFEFSLECRNEDLTTFWEYPTSWTLLRAELTSCTL